MCSRRHSRLAAIAGRAHRCACHQRKPGPAGKLAFRSPDCWLPRITGPDTPVTWRGEVLYHGSRKFSVWARVKISATMTRVVATQLILPGQTVAAGPSEVGNLR